MAGFTVDLRHLDGRAVVALGGDLDDGAVAALDDGFRPLLHRYDAAQLVIDAEELRSVDERAVHALLRILDRFGPTGLPTLLAPEPVLGSILDVPGAGSRFAAQPLKRDAKPMRSAGRKNCST